MTSARVVFHVGVHKTGSTLVQKFLRDRALQLHRHGIAYLDRQVLDPLISRGSVNRNDWDGLADALHGAVRATADELLITSHEGTMGPAFPYQDPSLYSRAAALAPRLAEVLAPHRPAVVVALRPQADFLESYYLQSIHTGKHLSFETWLSRLDLEQLSWRPLVDSLRAAFGPEHVGVLDFRTIRTGQEDYIRQFLALAAPGRDLPVDYAPTRNPSISAKGLELALAVNPLLRTHPERKAMRLFLQAHFSNRDYPRPTLLSNERRAWLDERYGTEFDTLTGR